MRRMTIPSTVALAMALLLVLPGAVSAKNTIACPEAPQNVNCLVDPTGDFIDASWDISLCSGLVADPPYPEAEKYSVSVDANYDTDDDGLEDMSYEFDFGTSDRTDGLPISEPNLAIPIADLVLTDPTTGATYSPLTAELKVKGLSHHTKKLRQNNTWSSNCSIPLPLPTP